MKSIFKFNTRPRTKVECVELVADLDLGVSYLIATIPREALFDPRSTW